MINRGGSVHQTSYDLMCQTLREVLLAAVQAGPDAADGIVSVQFRACAALYGLLLDHPVDEPGRCRSCRRPDALLGPRRRSCRVHIKASYWLRQLDVPLLMSQLANELGLAAAGAGRTTAPTLVPPPPVHHHPRAAR